MKKILIVLGAAAVLALSGCAQAQSPEKSPKPDEPAVHYVFQQEVEKDAFLTCAWADDGKGAGGLSCDWSSYNAGYTSKWYE